MALGDELLRAITLPLDVALETLRQPITPMLDADEYADSVDKQRFERNLPNFFRDVSRKLSEAQSVSLAQQSALADETASQQIADSVALANPPGGARFTPTTEGERSGTSAQIDPEVIDALSESLQAEQSGDRAVPPSEQQGGGLPAPSVSKTGLGGFLGKIKDAATDTLAPVGHAIEKGFDVGGRAVEAIPGLQGEGEAIGRVPEAAAAFKRKFGEGFEEKTGQPLGFETALAAINKYGLRDTTDRLARESDRVLTDYTIDPILHATLPDWAADPLVKATGVAASMLPYLAVSIANPAAGLAIGSTFALSATEDVKNLTAMYSRGDIDGKTFLLGVGLDLLDIVPEAAGPLVRSARRGFQSRRALAEAMDVVEGAKVEAAGKPPEKIAELTSDVEASKAVGDGVDEAAPTTVVDEAAVSAKPDIESIPSDVVAPRQVAAPEATVAATDVELARSPRSITTSAEEGKAMAVRERGRIVESRKSAEPIEEGIQGTRVFTTTKMPDAQYDSGSYFYRPDADEYIGISGAMKHTEVEQAVSQTGRDLADRGWVRMVVDKNMTGLSGALPDDLQRAARSMIRDGADPQDTVSFDFDVNDASLPVQNGQAKLVEIARGTAFGEPAQAIAAPVAEAVQTAPVAEAVEAVEAAPVATPVATPVAASVITKVDTRPVSEKMKKAGPRRRRYPVPDLPPEIATPIPEAVAAQSPRNANLRLSRELDQAAKGGEEPGISAEGDLRYSERIASPEAVRTRSLYRQKIAGSSTRDLQRRIDDPATPAWQKRESVLEVERRTTRAETRQENWKALSPYQRRLAEAQGYTSDPPLPAPQVHRVTTAMEELSPRMTVPEISSWLRRNADLVGDPDRYLVRDSAYWVQSRKGKVLDLGAVLADVRARVARTSGVDPRGQGVDSPVLAALKIKTKTYADGTLGICKVT